LKKNAGHFKGNKGVSTAKEDIMRKLRLIMTCALVILMAVALMGGCTDKPEEPPTDDVTASTEENNDVDYPSFASEEMSPPVKITIEKIGITDVDVLAVGIAQEGREKGHMATPPQADGVTWYDGAASPGWSYNAILTGHNYFNDVEGTFLDLHKLEIGDRVEFKYEDGSIGRFQVYSNNEYTDDAVPADVMLNEEITRTTLVTCGGAKKEGGGYTHRIIILLSAIEHVDKDGNPLKMYVPSKTPEMVE
jgi:LPXTG-site transpeptidase (sortase) family protein